MSTYWNFCAHSYVQLTVVCVIFDNLPKQCKKNSFTSQIDDSKQHITIGMKDTQTILINYFFDSKFIESIEYRTNRQDQLKKFYIKSKSKLFRIEFTCCSHKNVNLLMEKKCSV